MMNWCWAHHWPAAWWAWKSSRWWEVLAVRSDHLISPFQTLYKGSAAVQETLFFFLSFFLFFFFWFLGPLLRHMEVLRLGVELELQLPAYAMATATPDLSHVFKLHHRSWQCCTLNPLSEARDGTHILMDTSWACYFWALKGTPECTILHSTFSPQHSSSSDRSLSGISTISSLV